MRIQLIQAYISNLTECNQSLKSISINASRDAFSNVLNHEITPVGVNVDHASLKLPNIYESNMLSNGVCDKIPNDQMVLSSCMTINQMGLSKHSATAKRKAEAKISPPDPLTHNLPRTGINTPYLKCPPQFLQVVAESTPIISIGIDELSQKYKYREERKGDKPDLIVRRLVYDCFDSNDPSLMNSSANFCNYPMICMGRGAPTMYDKAYTKYVDSLPPFYSLTGEEDNTLIFESRFENGNLRRAVQVSEYEYDLFLKTDIGTTSFTQWFFFGISNVKKGKVQFLIRLTHSTL